MTQTLQVHLGDTLVTIGQRFVDAWHRAERGELTPDAPERHIGFANFDLFAHIISRLYHNRSLSPLLDNRDIILKLLKK